jgi:hypothetical protein
MNQIQQIAMLNQKSFSGPAWHGPSVEEVVGDVTADQAAARPALGRFSIWQHIRHMIFWKDKLTSAVRGDVMPRSSQIVPEENWPTITSTSEEAWQSTMSELRASQIRLLDAILDFSDDRLNETVMGCDYDFAFALHSMPCHDTYHAAQIVLLKKTFP